MGKGSFVVKTNQGETTSHREIPLGNQDQEKPRMLQNLVEDT